MTDFNELMEAEIDRHARQWEKTEERLQLQIDRLRTTMDEQKKAHAARKHVIDEARAVLDDYFDSPEPRSIHQAMGALRKIIGGG